MTMLNCAPSTQKSTGLFNFNFSIQYHTHSLELVGEKEECPKFYSSMEMVAALPLAWCSSSPSHTLSQYRSCFVQLSPWSLCDQAMAMSRAFARAWGTSNNRTRRRKLFIRTISLINKAIFNLKINWCLRSMSFNHGQSYSKDQSVTPTSFVHILLKESETPASFFSCASSD